jgi:hypothetical protein
MRAEEMVHNFRRNVEDNQEKEVVALRSSDIDHGSQSPFRKKVNKVENISTLTPMSVKTTDKGAKTET